MIETFIKMYEEGNITEAVVEQMLHFVFAAEDDEIFMIAQIFAAIGHAHRSVELVEALLDKHPEDVSLKTFLADVYLDLAEDEKALELLASIEDKSEAKIFMIEAELYLAQGLFEIAEAKLKKALALEPENELIRLAYAEFFHHIGDFEEALPHYLDLSECGMAAGVNVYERLATCYLHTGDFEEAWEQLTLSEKYFGTLSNDQLFNKAFLADQLARRQQALHLLQDIKKSDPSYERIYPLLAKIYYSEGDFEKGLYEVETGIKYNEYNSELHYLKGTILEAKKDLEGARDAYYEALNLDPDDLKSALRSNLICLQLEDYEEVIHNVAHYEESGLFDERFNWDLAVAHAELGEYEAALTHFQVADEHFRQDVVFLFDYATFLMEDGKRDLAQQKLETILEMDPSVIEAQEILATF